MITTTSAFSGYSVGDIEVARTFYGSQLGLDVSDGQMGNLSITLPGGAPVLLYPKDDHVPATFTVLNLVVPEIDAAVAELEAAGIPLENYGGYADERGILRGKSVGMGPNIAWFLDPSGNILSILEE
ncbi:VOC family protein [Frondihabitans cladoniiphilus]|uniref:VOC domain-containing protein n=1 Tax=Frondihabitans cladoniiphilus TaxID=715785 RepID=A0ABP8W8D6_9MICO